MKLENNRFAHFSKYNFVTLSLKVFFVERHLVLLTFFFRKMGEVKVRWEKLFIL